jgi:hypothetical protein
MNRSVLIRGVTLPKTSDARAARAMWETAGFSVLPNQRIVLPNLTIDISSSNDNSVGLVFGSVGERSIDGIPTMLSDDISAVKDNHVHPNGATRCYAVVAKTPSWRRTEAALFSQLGVEPAAVKTDIYPGQRLSFFKLLGSGATLELMAPTEEDEDPSKRNRPASIWGLTFEVSSDLNTLSSLLGGEALSKPRSAKQPGRQFATIKSAELAQQNIAVGFISTPIQKE